jgi:hypothetical protein
MSTIEQLAEMALSYAEESGGEEYTVYVKLLTESAAEFTAMRSQLEASERRESVLREALHMMRSQHFCGCGHPACNRCADIMECDAALAQEVGK